MKAPKNDNVPRWISEYIPQELVDSTLFKFNVTIQSVEKFKCLICGAQYNNKVTHCENTKDGEICGSPKLKAVFRTVEVNLLPDIGLSYEDLEEQMTDMPAQYAFWAAMYSESRCKVAIEERRLKAIKGKVTEELQRRSKDEKITLRVDTIKNIVESHTEIQESDMRLQKAQLQCGKLYHMVEALKMRAELARSLAGFKRRELEG